MNLYALQYPIGKPAIPTTITTATLSAWINVLEKFPKRLEELVENLSEEQLNTAYRPKGWTIKQVIHHVVDSHMNSYIRFKWTLTEETPVIKAYHEDRWATLFDSTEAPIELSLQLLKALHAKWVYFLKGLSEAELQKEFIHPETQKKVSLAENIGIYAWHCNHHYAHIENLRIRNNWK